MPTEAARLPSLNYDRLVDRTLWLFIFCGAIALVEPSPYDLCSFVTIPLWFMGGFRVHRFILPFVGLVAVYNFGGFVALIPYLDQPDPTLFMLQSLYLAVTVVFFALFFAERTVERADVCLKAFTAGAVLAAALGVLGYFDVGGCAPLFTLYGRAAGTFKDPNVLGSYLVLAALYLMQQLILGRARHPLLAGAGLLVLAAGNFLSFSRGSWGAFLLASAMTVALTYRANADRRVRRRVATTVVIALVLAGLGLAVLLSVDSIREVFLQRASGLQDYDTGENGRFGNQARSLSMLLDLLNGFGPLRFRLVFGYDPHNSYINSFASYGWLGGAAFFLTVGLTMVVGFRLALSRSPFARLAHVFWPALFVFLLQGFQIDIDHWRHVYLMLGAVWGIETARVRWLSERGGAPSPAPTRIVTA